MDTGLTVAVSSQMALEKRLNTIADNIANANTPGFRATSVRFDELVANTVGETASFVSRGKSYASTEHAGLIETGGSLDFAIRGDAWFMLETPSGNAVTRDGRFTRTPEGQLVSLTGHPVLDAGGAPIAIPGNGTVVAGADGTLSQVAEDGTTRRIGTIGLFAYDPGANFQRVGTSAILARTDPEPLVDLPGVGVVQGSIEGSNVNPVLEMTRLISVHRAFDNVAALMRDTEQATDSMIKTLGGAQ
ncbi:MAG: flagellar basal-body rod protein FlgF [Ahrensia sp.]|nr:flagellar basal-body rod protein FlgF [Ahrensia sp.]